MKRKLLLLASAVLSITAFAQTDDAPAFPGAEGHGRYVTGGRGGTVIHVTNLNNSGEGSFRAAVDGSAKKIIVFDVGGVIPLESDLTIGANTTIAGQTAPYPGITLRYQTVRPAANNIIRFIRFRRGSEKSTDDGADAIWQRQIKGVILDHCSMSWSTDELASFYDNNNFTMQWCILGEGLNSGHSKGAHSYGGIWGGKLASFHHNMICHVVNRAARFCGARYGWTGYKNNDLFSTYNWANTVQAENVDFRNCVVYNAGSTGACYGGPGGGQVNIVNNYYKAGPAKSSLNVTAVSVATSSNASSSHKELYGMTSRYYINGNTTETSSGVKTENRDWDGVTYDGGTYTIDGERWSLDTLNYYGDAVEHKANSNGKQCVRIRMDAEAPTGEVTTHAAATAFDKVMLYGGSSLFRDDVDARYTEEAKSGTVTYTGSINNLKGIIDVVSDCNGYTEENFGTGSRPEGFDTDGDGMPDEWETANGLDPNDPSDASLYTLDTQKQWYNNLEVYLNCLVEDIMKNENADAISAVNEYYPLCNTSGITIPVQTSEVAKIEYFTIGGVKLSTPVKGISIRKITYSNGKTAADKIIR